MITTSCTNKACLMMRTYRSVSLFAAGENRMTLHSNFEYSRLLSKVCSLNFHLLPSTVNVPQCLSNSRRTFFMRVCKPKWLMCCFKGNILHWGRRIENNTFKQQVGKTIFSDYIKRTEQHRRNSYQSLGKLHSLKSTHYADLSLRAGSHLGAHARAAKSEFKSEVIL